MHGMILAGFGIAAGALNTIALVPYIRDIFRGKTKPERATWWVFLALSGFALVGQVQAGVRWALLATIADACGVVAVGKLNATQLLYPAYILLANGLLMCIIIVRRPQVPHDATDV